MYVTQGPNAYTNTPQHTHQLQSVLKYSSVYAHLNTPGIKSFTQFLAKTMDQLQECQKLISKKLNILKNTEAVNQQLKIVRAVQCVVKSVKFLLFVSKKFGLS